jgi:hypothetical protein
MDMQPCCATMPRCRSNLRCQSDGTCG